MQGNDFCELDSCEVELKDEDHNHLKLPILRRSLLINIEFCKASSFHARGQMESIYSKLL